ncbi:MAG: serine/threonine protein kinase [Syntrophobacterales bacterium]|nr:MAG: serine/threonine protein kinase [Syntrophobacterales bacterium]
MGSTFAGRYQVIEELGHGGMGRVYKVQDTDIKEKVALKVLRPEITLDKETVERFSNELKLARKISHRNVCRMFDLGRAEGTTFITMEFVPGEDLKSFLHRAKQLSMGTAISIARQVCEGLEEAHRQGVVHRDLKPGNIMIDKDGDAKIMDFGIARSISGKGITGAGVLIGTPEYMSPEQVEGKDIDQRSDIYSLGVILYEMVTGRIPFAGDTPLSVAHKHKYEAPEDPKTFNSQLPDDLGGVILRCLEKDKSKRYQTAANVKTELEQVEKSLPTTEKAASRRATSIRKAPTAKEITVKFVPKRLIIPALAIVVVIIAAYFLLRSRPAKTPAISASIPSGSARPAKPALDPKRVVVALFENRTGDATLDTVALMAADSLTRALLQSGEAGVAANPAIASGGGSLKKSPAGPSSTDAFHTLAVQTGAGLVVTGGIYLERDMLRFESQLFDATKAQLAFALNPVTGPRARPSEVIASMGQRVMTAVAYFVEGSLYPGRYIPTYEAYREANLGEAALGIDYDAAHSHYELALKLDPSWFALRLSMSMALSDRNMYREAAAQLDLLEPHAGALAPYVQQGLRMNRAWLKGKYSEALQASQERDRLAPSLDSATGYIALCTNQPRLAVNYFSKLSVRPDNPSDAWEEYFLTDAHHMLGEYAEELEIARQGRVRFPSQVGFHGREARALIALGRLAEAEQAVEESLVVQWISDLPRGTEISTVEKLDPGQVMCLVSMELAAHGHQEAFLAMAGRAVAWFESRPSEEAKTPAHQWLLALAFYLAERWEDAQKFYEPMAHLDRPIRAAGWSEENAFALTVRFRGRLGVIAVQRGDRAGAERIAAELRRVEHPYLFGENLYQCACIAAQLGDKAKAVELLRDAIAEGFGGTLDWYGYAEAFHRAPELAPLHGYKPFEELIRPRG